MGLKDIGESLPPGFRFYPSDEELVCHYLIKKIANEEALKGTLVDIDLHTCEPWQLPEVAKLNSSEWYFFSFRDRKYATGYRTNRATGSGYWKATGKDRVVHNPKTRAIVGMRKTLVFYRNRAPNGIKTSWIMHEFRLENPHTPPKEDWVLCRVFQKSKGNSNNSNTLSPQYLLETTHCATSSIIPDQTLPYGYHKKSSISITQTPPHHYQKLINPNSTLLNLSAINPNFTQQHFPQETNNSSVTNEINSKCEDDEYGFLLDMGFDEENSLVGVPENLDDEVRFEDDNSMVFL